MQHHKNYALSTSEKFYTAHYSAAFGSQSTVWNNSLLLETKISQSTWSIKYCNNSLVQNNSAALQNQFKFKSAEQQHGETVYFTSRQCSISSVSNNNHMKQLSIYVHSKNYAALSVVSQPVNSMSSNSQIHYKVFATSHCSFRENYAALLCLTQ